MINEIRKTRTSFLGSLSASSKIIAVSSNASDTTQTASIAGSSSDSFTLDGIHFVTGTVSLTSISAIALGTSAAGTVSFYQEGLAAEAVLYFISGAFANNDTVTLGVSGFQRVYTFKDTLTGAANEVKVGATNADSTQNLVHAINLTGTIGTDYGTGTTIHKHHSAVYVAATTTFKVVDKTKIRRTTTTSEFSSNATGAVTTPFSTGNTGTLIATLTTGETSVAGIISLTNLSLSASNLPASTKFVSDWIRVRGNNCALRFLCESVTTPLPTSYQVSLDGQTVLSNGQGTIPSLDNDLTATYFAVPEVCEFLRVLIDNPNVVNVKVHGTLISSA